MGSMKKHSLLALIAASIALTSCNTMIGIGRDLKIGGEGLENAANKAGGGGSSSSSASADTGGAPIY